MLFFCIVRKPADLQDLAPGTNPPFVTFNGEVKVDVNKIEEFLEEKLIPPWYTNTHLLAYRWPEETLFINQGYTNKYKGYPHIPVLT